MIKKIDNTYRFLIPRQMLFDLGLDKGSSVNIEREDNKIIITKVEDDLELNLEPQEMPETTKPKEILEKIEVVKEELRKYNKDDIIGFNGTNEVDTCIRCGHPTFNSMFTLNDKSLCLHCFKDLKIQIKEDIRKNG